MIGMLVSVVCGAVVVARALAVAAHIRRGGWPRWQFALFSLSIAATSAGALGLVIGYPFSGPVILAGLAGSILFDRRKHRRGRP